MVDRDFDDPLPTEYYRQFAERAGCLQGGAQPQDLSVFKCLQNADSVKLQNASAETNFGAEFGQWAFIPVTDGRLIQQRPSQQLLSGRVNGERILTGVSQQEGP
jgi:hypothetical protein